MKGRRCKNGQRLCKKCQKCHAIGQFNKTTDTCRSYRYTSEIDRKEKQYMKDFNHIMRNWPGGSRLSDRDAFHSALGLGGKV